jgi:formylmethanofuran dehydrogenase subunit E
MNYTHVIRFFDENKPPVYLNQEQIKKLKDIQPMPQMIWVGDQCHNISGIDSIIELKKSNIGQPKKCDKCHEYMINEICPTCNKKNPTQIQEGQKKLSEIGKLMGYL